MTGQEIAEWRKKNKWSQTQVARAVGTDQSIVSKWERGLIQPPDDECPFDGLANGRISCALLHLNDANAEDITIKKAIIAAVDEARKEEVDQKPTTPSRTTPDHYRLDPEPIEVIRGWNLGFCLGNVIKYIARAGHKAGESRDKDLHKAMEYLRMELEDEGK